MKENLHPTTFIIFGATGDLFQKKIASALYSLYVKNELPAQFEIVAFARKPFTKETFRDYVRALLPSFANPQHLDEFLSHISYSQGQFDMPEDYHSLAQDLQKVDQKFGICTNKLFYLAVPPAHYHTIFNNLSLSGLTIPCGGNKGWTRVLVEKPFGSDLVTAQKLDKEIAKLFEEEQIFIIDHYLAKEPMQNILAFRFLNSIFEPIWNKKHIESIEINLFEMNDVSKRGDFYDGVGALRDVGQNHVLQMLALVAMEKPKKFDVHSIRHERTKVISKLGKVKESIRAQYENFTKEGGVKPLSTTETFFSLLTTISTTRWKGVPIRLTAGKALSESKAEIVVKFKKVGEHQNAITFRIQPDEAILLHFVVKMPGFRTESADEALSFVYKSNEHTSKIADAYEKVLFDAIVGDQTLFASSEEIKSSWAFITPILSSWSKSPLFTYKKGSNPKEIIAEHIS